MSPMLMFASLAITGALVLYTIGVFKSGPTEACASPTSSCSGSAWPVTPPAPP